MLVQCPSCERPQEPQLICSDCRAPLASNLDYFTTLGLPRKLQVDLTKLEATYHEFGRTLHPDRFANASSKVRDASLRATALLTRSYRTLREPAARAAYWLELHGQKLAENNQSVPPALAALVFEAQEELAEMRDTAGSSSSEAAELREKVANRRLEVDNLLESSDAELDRVFAAVDEAGEPPPVELIARLKATLAEGKYLGTLMRDLRKALDTAAAA